MQYNKWTPNANNPDSKEDPIFDTPGHAIAPRFDIVNNFMPTRAAGAIDSKVTNFSNANELRCFAISGPTHDNQSVFEWKDRFLSLPHKGLPTTWNYSWQTMDPDTINANSHLQNTSNKFRFKESFLNFFQKPNY